MTSTTVINTRTAANSSTFYIIVYYKYSSLLKPVCVTVVYSWVCVLSVPLSSCNILILNVLELNTSDLPSASDRWLLLTFSVSFSFFDARFLPSVCWHDYQYYKILLLVQETKPLALFFAAPTPESLALPSPLISVIPGQPPPTPPVAPGHIATVTH